MYLFIFSFDGFTFPGTYLRRNFRVVYGEEAVQIFVANKRKERKLKSVTHR
jgi:hypothetical protein